MKNATIAVLFIAALITFEISLEPARVMASSDSFIAQAVIAQTPQATAAASPVKITVHRPLAVTLFAIIVIITLGIVVWALVDVARHDVRWLPKWAWVVICLLSIPLGAVVFLIVGRERDVRPPSTGR